MRTRIVQLVIALCALALVPASALAAPKKAQIKFSASAYSVAETAGTFSLVVQRSGSTSVTASANLSISAATTAVGGGVDYSYSGPSSVSFGPGETTKTIPVSIVDNSTANAPNKTIVFELSAASPAGTLIKNSPTTVTIVDNEGPGTLDFSATGFTVVESAGVATIAVNRSGATNLQVAVDYATTLAGSTASATTDYTPISPAQTLIFNPGETSKTFQVHLMDDSDAEAAETVALVLSNPRNLSGGGAPQVGTNSPATLTINDDDVSTFSFQSTLFQVSETAGSATISVVRGGATNVAASVGYATSHGSAGGSDYTPASGTLAFAAGETTKTFSVGVLNDGVAESNETVNLTLTQNGNPVATSILSIVDNDNPMGSVQFSDVAYRVSEASSTAVVTVTLSHAVDGDVTVDYATTGGTATAGADYVATSGTLTFVGNLNSAGAGQTQKTFTIDLLPDADVEDSETIGLLLTNVGPGASAIAGDPSTATMTIADDDPAGDLQFAALRYDVDERDGSVVVAVERVGGSSGTVQVDYATSDGSAAAGTDYTAVSGTLTFAPGETTKTFSIPVAWDGRAENAETINVALSNPAGGAELSTNSAAAIRIADDGPSGPVRFTATTASVGEADGTVTIALTRSGGSLGGPVSVDYAGGGTSGTVTFAAGEATNSFTIGIADDQADDDGESFQVGLSNVRGGAAIGSPATLTVSVIDDDAPATTSSLPAAANAQPPAPDRTAPAVALSTKRVQRVFKLRRLLVTARCMESCRLSLVAKTGDGRRAITLGKARVAAAANQKRMISIKLSRRALAKLARVLRAGKAKVTISVVASDAAGNRSTARRVVTVRR